MKWSLRWALNCGHEHVQLDDVEKACIVNVCQPGSNLLAAGYCMYSSSCIMVLSVGDGVYGFTLDPMYGEFVMTHDNIKIPKSGKIYSFNEGNYMMWSDKLKSYMDSLKVQSKTFLLYLLQHPKAQKSAYQSHFASHSEIREHRLVQFTHRKIAAVPIQIYRPAAVREGTRSVCITKQPSHSSGYLQRKAVLLSLHWQLGR